MLKKGLLLFRIKDWWYYIFPPLLAFAYLHLLHDGAFDKAFAVNLSLLSASIFGTASFGFLLNDITDTKQDALSDRRNYAALSGKNQLFILLIITIGFALLPWLYLIKYKTAFGLYMVQMGLLVLYAVPPFRIKRNVWLCILTDAFYSSVIPVFITIFIFSSINAVPNIFFFYTLVFNLFFLKGLRNILMHQLLEQAQDKKAGIATLVLKYGEKPIKTILKKIFVPIEIILITVFSIYIAVFVNGFFGLIIPVFLLHFSLKQFTKIYSETKSVNAFQTLNDYYEDYLPLTILIIATFNNIYLTSLLVLHLLLFPKPIRNHVWPLLSRIYYMFFVHLLYHGVLVWLYYKVFHNKYVRKYRQRK